MDRKYLWSHAKTGVKHAFEYVMAGDRYVYNRSVCGMAQYSNCSDSHIDPLHECNQCTRIIGGVPRGPRKTPYQKIRDAADRGTGVQLTADDVGRLAMDDAIMTRASLDDEPPDDDTDTAEKIYKRITIDWVHGTTTREE